jgi:hypothetical protein
MAYTKAGLTIVLIWAGCKKDAVALPSTSLACSDLGTTKPYIDDGLSICAEIGLPAFHVMLIPERAV